MIKFLILNNSGDVIYHSTEPKNQHAISELSKIRYLPLLLTKDLLKASFHDRIQYLHTRKKTTTFLEVINNSWYFFTFYIYNKTYTFFFLFLFNNLETWFIIHCMDSTRNNSG